MSRRKDQLTTIAKNFFAMHDEWANDDNRENPDEIYWDGVTDLVESFEKGDVPADCRTLTDAVMAFADEADAFESRTDERQLYPKESFWRALEKVRQVVDGPTRRELPPLESIAELAKLPYMQHAQIAEIYGFKDRRGHLLTRLVQMELDAPGSVIGEAAKGKGLVDGRDWKDPRVDEIDNEEGAADRAFEAIEAKGRRARKESAPCKETDAELWEQGVSAEQAAAMLKQDVAGVRKRFADWTAAAAFNRKVWELVDKGVPAGEICKQLRTDPKKVQAAIEEREKMAAGVGAGAGTGSQGGG